MAENNERTKAAKKREKKREYEMWKNLYKKMIFEHEANIEMLMRNTIGLIIAAFSSHILIGVIAIVLAIKLSR